MWGKGEGGEPAGGAPAAGAPAAIVISVPAVTTASAGDRRARLRPGGRSNVDFERWNVGRVIGTLPLCASTPLCRSHPHTVSSRTAHPHWFTAGGQTWPQVVIDTGGPAGLCQRGCPTQQLA